MRKYFYLVNFSYFVNENDKSDFDLGIFSTRKNALKKIEQAKTQVGFNQYSEENFKITKFGVNFEKAVIDKSSITLYCLSHEYAIDDDCYYWTIFDYFSSYELAEKELNFLREHSRIGKKYPSNFEINEVRVDNYNDWSEGFTRIDSEADLH